MRKLNVGERVAFYPKDTLTRDFGEIIEVGERTVVIQSLREIEVDIRNIISVRGEDGNYHKLVME